MAILNAAASPLKRSLEFIAAYRAAKNDDDIEIRIGCLENGTPAIVVSIAGSMHAFTVGEARKLASIVEAGLNECPNDPEAASLPNLILALRGGADLAERTTPPQEPR